VAGSRWVRLDVDYFHNPKVLAAGRDGRDLHLASICWVGSQLTDGVIPAQVVPILIHDARIRGQVHAQSAIDAVCAAGLWIPNGDGFHLHDFTNMNGTRLDAERERERWRENQRRHRARGDDS